MYDEDENKEVVEEGISGGTDHIQMIDHPSDLVQLGVVVQSAQSGVIAQPRVGAPASAITTHAVTARNDQQAPVNDQKPHPAITDRNFYRTLNNHGEVMWNSFWDKLLFLEAEKKVAKYNNLVDGRPMSWKYKWPKDDLWILLKMTMTIYVHECQEKARKKCNEALALSGTPHDLESSSKETKKSKVQKMLKISAAAFTQHTMKNAPKSSGTEANSGHEFAHISAMRKDFLHATNRTKPSDSKAEDAATVWHEAHEANEKYRMCFFALQILKDEALLRDGIVANFSIKDEGNHYAHAPFPPNPEMGNVWLDAVIAHKRRHTEVLSQLDQLLKAVGYGPNNPTSLAEPVHLSTPIVEPLLQVDDEVYERNKEDIKAFLANYNRNNDEIVSHMEEQADHGQKSGTKNKNAKGKNVVR